MNSSFFLCFFLHSLFIHPASIIIGTKETKRPMATISIEENATSTFSPLQKSPSHMWHCLQCENSISQNLGSAGPQPRKSKFSYAIPGDGNGKSGIREASNRQTENIKKYESQIQNDASDLSVNSEQFAKQVRYVLVNQHPLVQFHPQNWSPLVKFIGGIHVEEFAHNLKEDSNRKILYSKSDCLVLFSIGTLKSISQQGSKFVNIIFSVFAAYPKCHFIMSNFDEKNMSAHERKQILQHSKNIEIVQGFVQQREILAQPNLRLFISHCGQNSLNEAVYFGVPIICIPFSFDQFYNAAIVEFLGNGKFLKNDKVGATLPEALNEMLEIKNNKYRIIAQKLNEMIMDYPKRSDEFISVVDKGILELEQNEMPKLIEKSTKEGWTFDSPILDDNFVKIAEEDLF